MLSAIGSAIRPAKLRPKKFFQATKRGLKKLKSDGRGLSAGVLFGLGKRNFKKFRGIGRPKLPLGGGSVYRRNFAGSIEERGLFLCDYRPFGTAAQIWRNRSSNQQKSHRRLGGGIDADFCCGETREQRIDGQITDIAEKQIEEGLKDVDLNSAPVMIAYEPVWAIGAGQACDSEEAAVISRFIKTLPMKNSAVIRRVG